MTVVIVVVAVARGVAVVLGGPDAAVAHPPV